MNINTDHYTYRVTWSSEDNEYLGVCVEFSSLSWLAKKPELALRGIRKLVFDMVEDMAKNHEPIPEPMVTRQYSGKFIVRVPPEIHRALAIQAAESRVSLNRLVSTKLSQMIANPTA